MSKRALSITREQSFPEWYQAAVHDGDMAETSPVRGCMIIKPWGWGVWERIQAELDARIKDTGHDNCYFPLFIPMSFIAKEAEHVEGFAKEMAVVTHHRLKNVGGKLVLDPEAVLEEPLIVRPTSETIIGDAFQRWIKSYRDLPLLINQWANVVRWEMRTRLFLRTAEFLWQEGHTAHADRDDAMLETLKMLEVYREFAETVLAMPVVTGEKPANERFPGADHTYSIEAMMQDGKALQAGTSHYLGTHFAEAQNIQYQNQDGKLTHCHTTSWGVSTRLIGGVIMSHGDDDGLRMPPKIAPRQIVIVPMLRDKPEDQELKDYCAAIEKDLKAQGIRVLVDGKPVKSAEKRWNWVRRGAPIIVEIGGRDASGGNVTFMRRDKLRDGDKVVSHTKPRADFVAGAQALLDDIQASLFAEAKARLDSNIVTTIKTFDELKNYFGVAAGDDEGGDFKGWASIAWSKPEGTKLEAVADRLKALKLTIRNAPLEQPKLDGGTCLFTGEPAREYVLIGRSY
jgi:prolyl-tRNA synthetase